MSANPSCLSIADGCTICRRAGDGLSCSTPGTACLVGAPVCTAGMAGAEDGGKRPVPKSE